MIDDDDDDDGIDIEDDDEPREGNEEAAPKTLAERYADQMRQVFLQKIELPIKTLLELSKDGLDLSPSFQRRDVWDAEKQSRFIESIIMNVPIPPVFLGEDQYGHYLVLDGRQRLTAILDYLKNDYELKKLKVWKDLNGLRFNDLKLQDLDASITRRFVPAILLLKESSDVLKYDVFDRLNTGGVIAKPMEIRNAVYRGRFTENLKTLSDSAEFRRLWAIPLDDIERQDKSKLFQRMRDLELVLRFFALSDRAAYDADRLAFKDYLSNYMKLRNKKYDADAALEKSDGERFLRGLRNVLTVFGEDAFIRQDKRSAPLADALLTALCEHDPSGVRQRKELLKEKLEELRQDPSYVKALSRGTNGRGAILERLDKSMAAVNSVMA